MNALPRFPYNEPEEHFLIQAKWHRQAEERAMRRLCGIPDPVDLDDEDQTDTIPMVPESDLPPATELYDALVEEEANDRASGREWL